eukprot:scaffold172679_cov33-Tisochrysis_lutea.AAC.2
MSMSAQGGRADRRRARARPCAAAAAHEGAVSREGELGASSSGRRVEWQDSQSSASSPHAAACTSGKLEHARAPVMHERTRIRSRSSGLSASACLMSIKFCRALVMSELPCVRQKHARQGGRVQWRAPQGLQRCASQEKWGGEIERGRRGKRKGERRAGHPHT